MAKIKQTHSILRSNPRVPVTQQCILWRGASATRRRTRAHSGGSLCSKNASRALFALPRDGKSKSDPLRAIRLQEHPVATRAASVLQQTDKGRRPMATCHRRHCGESSTSNENCQHPHEAPDMLIFSATPAKGPKYTSAAAAPITTASPIAARNSAQC